MARAGPFRLAAALWAAGCLAAGGANAAGAPAPAPAGVAFQAVSADETGIAAAMAKWKADELKRQGGTFGSHGWWPWGLTAFDIDNDGDLDLMPTHHGTPRGMILRNLLAESGKLTFVDATRQFGVDTRDLPIADALPYAWDFDGDGWLDIAGFSDETKCPCLLNDRGKRLVKADFTFQPLSYLGKVADVNGDGYPDVTGRRRGRLYTFLFDPKARTFRRQETPVPVPAGLPAGITGLLDELKRDRNNRFMRVRFPGGHDLDGDGTADVVMQVFASYSGSRLGRYLIAGAGGKLVDRTEALGLPADGAPVLVADVSGDGLADVLVIAAPTGGLYLADGRGRFALKPGPLTDFLKGRDPYAHKVHRVDLDNDTDADLVVERPRTGRLAAFENVGGGTFRQVLAAKKWDAYPTAICDINDDGLVDIVAGGPGKEQITIYLNRTRAAGGSCKLYPRMPRPNWAAIGATVEVFPAGQLGRPGTRPYWTQPAHVDATGVHVGLGKARRIDVRVTFPARGPVAYRNLEAAPRIKLHPDGRSARLSRP